MTDSKIQNNWLMTERRKGVDLACLIKQYLRMCDTYDMGLGSTISRDQLNTLPPANDKSGTRETLLEMADRLGKGRAEDESWAIFHKKQLSKSEINRKRIEVEDACSWFFQTTWEKDRKLNQEGSNAKITTDARNRTE
jgi:hypothetical protein